MNRRICFGMAVVMACGIGIKIHAENLNSKIENEISITESKSEIEPVQIITEEFEPEFEIVAQEPEVYQEMIPCYPIDDWERREITRIVCGEARGESMEGKMAVAQTIMCSMIQDETDVTGVKSKFNGYADLENSNPDVWQECVDAVSLVFDDGELPIAGEPLWFYAHKTSYSKWHETSPNLEWLATIDGHKFFGLKNRA